MRSSLLLMCALGFGQGGAPGAPRPYTLDPSASQIAVHVGKAGLLRFAGHEQDVIVGSFRGTVTVDPERIERSAVDVTIDAASLRIDAKGKPAKDVAEVQATMLGAKCLDVARYPSIRFVSKSVSAGRGDAGGRDLAIRGDVTLHGVTREITISVRLELGADSLQATGTTTLRQKDFGITPISIAGVIKVKNELPVSWRLIGNR